MMRIRSGQKKSGSDNSSNLHTMNFNASFLLRISSIEFNFNLINLNQFDINSLLSLYDLNLALKSVRI